MPDSLTVAADVFLGRQPILDREQKLYAYELLFRSSLKNQAFVTDNILATATVITNVFSELSISDALGQYRGFINVDTVMLFSDTLSLLPKDSVVLELLETIEITPDVVDRCKYLQHEGFILALDDIVQLGEAYRPIMDYVEIVKVDLKAIDSKTLPSLVAQIKRLGKKALAEKVDSREEMLRCHALGFDLFQGYYFAKPTILQGKKLSHSQLALLRLMTLLQREAENEELEAIFKHEPGLTLNLLRLTNSVGSGLTVKVTSLRHIITVLGRRQLKRWLQLLLYTVDTPGGTNPLLQLAASRARLMELLAEKIAPGQRSFIDDAFMVGILSLTPVLLGQPIEDIINGINLTPEVHAALTGPKGIHGDLLQLTERLEDPQGNPIELLERLPNIGLRDINQSLAKAIAWANDLAREAA